ncbi:GDP-L-fucose synthase [Chromobacterium sp. IIBBL 290-4]|uniref:GDP-L-fucose synthase family protein n=1 Tax=Chromobacterium sp. IIBBL 290-4 TaxID=2953890 RepID=UPI0020B645D2|nr:GDP-L-fucose synthase [Chromobacterium sp. IIBBL 290-4]UTH72834.1 GDP-L-fucose synthase [Chromobacterium sp. IIBBL 290-4]
MFYINQMACSNIMNKNSSIYIAGHGGLIGSALLRKLSTEGFENILVRARSELDLLNYHCVMDFFCKNKPEYVVLAAGKVGGIESNQNYPADFIVENIQIQLNILSAARENNVRKLIFFGSSCMYPRDCKQPMSENDLLTGKPEGTSLPYAIAKLAGIHTCLAYNKQDGNQRFVPVIPNSVYGPNDNFDARAGHVLSALISKFHKAKLEEHPKVVLWGTGSARREFVHADDVADACMHLLFNDISSLELPVNLGSGYDVSIKDLALRIAKLSGFNGDIHWDLAKPDGSPQKLLNSARINAIGWFPKVSLDDGLLSTYEWYVREIGRSLTENEGEST